MATDGLCECGCGQRTSLAKRTIKSRGQVKGQPVRYCMGHSTRKPRPLCACGCGERVVDHRARWVKGHDKRIFGAPANPTEFCMCGCGQLAPIATKSRPSRGIFEGQPIRFIKGHYGQVFESWRIDTTTGCWIWTGRTFETEWDTRPLWGDFLAYRRMWEKHVGPIPKGHHLHHKCENPMCVNPDHLEPLTPAEHKRRHLAAA